jgi:myo-inositol-1(or 4)-monophosphatase
VSPDREGGSRWTSPNGELELAVETARQAAALLVSAFAGGGSERRKGPHDVVTEFDHASEALIMGILGSAFPADRRLGEETGLTVPRRASTRTWIVDPLDGTVNFASGLPFWCVSIALAIDQRVVLGVIRDPLRDETIVATAGGGARRLPTGEGLELRRLRRAADAVVVGDPGSADDPEAQLRIARLRPQVRAVRALGSIAFSLTSLATGRLDGVLQVRGLQAVDVAAAGLIACEAGARVTDAEGGPWLVVAEPARGTGIAAARPGLHRRLVPRA